MGDSSNWCNDIEFHEQYDLKYGSYIFTTFAWLMITWRTLIIIIIISSSPESLINTFGWCKLNKNLCFVCNVDPALDAE